MIIPSLWLCSGVAFLLTWIILLIVSIPLIYVPEGNCVVYFHNLRKTYSVYYPGYWWSGWDRFFIKKVSTILKEKHTHLLDTRVFSDPIRNYDILSDTKLSIVIDCDVYLQIKDPILFVTASSNPDQVIDTTCKAELRNSFSTLDIDGIVTTQDNIEKELLASLNTDLESYGLICVDITLTRVCLPKPIAESVTAITSKQMQQKCQLIDAETKTKVFLKKLELKKEKEKVNMLIKDKTYKVELEALLNEVRMLKDQDPSIDSNRYIENRFKALAYKNSEKVIFYEPYSPSKKIEINDSEETLKS